LPTIRWSSVIVFLTFCTSCFTQNGYAQTDQVNGSIEALKSPDAAVRYQAAITLGKLKDPRAIQPLIVALKDADFSVRLQAAGALGKLGEPAIIPLSAVFNDPDVNARRSAAYALGEIKGPRAVDPLVAALKDANRLVRRDAAEALGKIRDIRAIGPLISGIADDESTFEFWEFRRSATDALVSIGEPAVEPLIAALNDGPLQLRRYAAMALGEIRITPVASPVRVGAETSSEDPRAVARLLTGLKERDTAVLVGACRFFIRRGEAGAEAPLIQALNAKGDDDTLRVFLNCGNYELEAAATKWASEHGYRITSMSSRYGSSIRWGSQR
jgi:HEAT repeat protein